MKKILVIEDRPDMLELIDGWVSFNYPDPEKCAIIKASSTAELSGINVGEHEVVIFTGSLSGIPISEVLEVSRSWKNRLFIYYDDDLTTRQFLVKLRREKIQTFRLVP